MLFIGSQSFSQTSNVKNLPVLLSNFSYDKTFAELLAQFQILFPNAENVSFYNSDENLGARFTMNSLRYRVLLNKKGRLISKITQGTEKILPTDLRKMVKREYVEFIITAAALVEEGNRQIWVIHLEDDSQYVVARVENGELNENMKYTKAK